MVVRVFRFADNDQTGKTACGAVSESIGAGRFFDDAVLRICPALCVEREYAGAHQSRQGVRASCRIYQHLEGDGQAVRGDHQFLGEGRTRATFDTATVRAILIIFVTTNNVRLNVQEPDIYGHQTGIFDDDIKVEMQKYDLEP